MHLQIFKWIKLKSFNQLYKIIFQTKCDIYYLHFETCKEENIIEMSSIWIIWFQFDSFSTRVYERYVCLQNCKGVALCSYCWGLFLGLYLYFLPFWKPTILFWEVHVTMKPMLAKKFKIWSLIHYIAKTEVFWDFHTFHIYFLTISTHFRPLLKEYGSMRCHVKHII